MRDVTVGIKAFIRTAELDAALGSLVGKGFAQVIVADDSRMDDMADPGMLAGLEHEDPRALASFMRRMSDEMGEPMDAEMDEMVGRLEAGESPEEIEKSLPDVGDAGAGEDASGE